MAFTEQDITSVIYTEELAGTCGTLGLGHLPRSTKEQVVNTTKWLKKNCSGYGVIITAVKKPTKREQKWMAAAGWQKTLEYRGQYDEAGWGYNKNPKYYPMTHWCLVIKPWKEPKVAVTKKAVKK